jgi:hypothetical protein
MDLIQSVQLEQVEQEINKLSVERNFRNKFNIFNNNISRWRRRWFKISGAPTKSGLQEDQEEEEVVLDLMEDQEIHHQ